MDQDTQPNHQYFNNIPVIIEVPDPHYESDLQNEETVLHPQDPANELSSYILNDARAIEIISHRESLLLKFAYTPYLSPQKEFGELNIRMVCDSSSNTPVIRSGRLIQVGTPFGVKFIPFSDIGTPKIQEYPDVSLEYYFTFYGLQRCLTVHQQRLWNKLSIRRKELIIPIARVTHNPLSSSTMFTYYDRWHQHLHIPRYGI